MSAMSYLQKHPKSGVYRIRRAIPSAARFAFDGKREFLKSLRTKEYRKALSLAMPIIADLQQRIDKALGLPLFDTNDDREWAVAAFLQWHWSNGGDDVGYDEYIFDSEQEFLTRLTGFCAVVGFLTNDSSFEEIRQVIESEEDRLFDRTATASASSSSVVTNIHQPVITPTAAPTHAGRRLKRQIKLSELCEELLDYKGNSKPKTEQEIRKTFSSLIELHGDLLLSKLDMELVREFRDLLLNYPVTGRTKEILALPLRQVAGMKWDHTLSPITVKRQMGHIDQGFAFAVSEGFALFNPCDGLLIRSSTPSSKKVVRRGFRPHELRKLFSSPLFTQCGGIGRESKSGSVEVRNFRYWLPWVAFYTGARLAELCQLEKTNLRQDGDIWFLEITVVADDEDVADKSLKTEGSTRNVPVHQILVDKGFIDYAQSGTSPYIFSSKYNSPEALAKAYSTWFGRYMTKFGLTDPATVFHSSRHNFVSACRKANIVKEVHEAFTGHKPQDVGGRYGRHDRLMSYLKGEIDRVEFDGID